ncbi:NAD(P)H-hydrate dehydratase [Natronospora cellulosivora (SeqCode)]
MIILKPDEMRKVDQAVIDDGYPDMLLMEAAGRAIAEKLRFLNDDCSHGDCNCSCSKSNRVLVFAGKGNNGGDGLVAARYLDMWGFDVKVVLLSELDELKESPLINYRLCKLRDIEVIILSKNKFSDLIDDIDYLLSRSDIIIDALLGTGITGKPKKPYDKIIELINNSNAEVLSVDIPSGVDGETGKVESEAVWADYTMTLAYPKIGLTVYPGREYCGEIEIADIGIPDEYVYQQKAKHFILDKSEASFLLPARPNNSHKGSYGKVGVLGGSNGMAGAPTLTASAALRVGAGLIRVAVPDNIESIVATHMPELITVGLKDLGTLYKVENIEKIENLMQESDVLAVGPGMGKSDCTDKIIEKIIEEYQGPLILDADGINSIKDLNILKKRNNDIILTPHPGEMASLLACEISEVEENRIEIARNFACENQVYLILKGASTVIALVDGRIFINPNGNPGMATAGSGDVLAGILAGMIAQGVAVEDAVVLCPYLHGLAGDIAAEKLSSHGMAAGDIILHLSDAIKELQ